MEDRTFALLEKMYSEMSSNFEKINKKIESIENKVDTLDKDIKKIGATVEGEVKTKIEALFDGYIANSEKLDEVLDKIDNMQIDINSLTIKSLRSDSTIIEIKKKLKV